MTSGYRRLKADYVHAFFGPVQSASKTEPNRNGRGWDNSLVSARLQVGFFLPVQCTRLTRLSSESSDDVMKFLKSSPTEQMPVR